MQIVLNKKTENLYSTTAPLQMKTFSGNDFVQIEVEVNEWFKKHSIMVQHICQSQCERNGKLLLLVSVFYSPLND